MTPTYSIILFPLAILNFVIIVHIIKVIIKKK